MKRFMMLAMGVAMAAVATGCRRAELTGPPELRVGRDECKECGMLVAEDRCAAAALIEFRGGREHRLFDDIGCLIDYELALEAGKGEEGERIVEFWVRDYDARSWVGGGDAVYLAADREKLRTPMGTGIVAFGAREGAERLRGAAGGEVVEYAVLKRRRAE